LRSSVDPASGPRVGAAGGGYPPIRDLAAVGDGRTVALVSNTGTVEWLPLPYVDSAPVFGALLDRNRSGSFTLAPTDPYEVSRRYVPDTNVLETTFRTAGGSVRVSDAMTLSLGGGLLPFAELARRIEGLSGDVAMRWRVEPRFGYGSRAPRITGRAGVPVAASGSDAIAVNAWGAGETQLGPDHVEGTFTVAGGARAMLSLAIAHQEPLVIPSRAETERRLDLTAASWRRWVADRAISQSPYRDAMVRSALVLKLLIHAPTGALAAAPTTSLPEEIGGEQNWDYRFSWVRDSAFAMNALLEIGCQSEAEAFLWWLMHASQLTHPRLQVLYRLDGGLDAPERTLPLDGYAGSRPVRTGNAAVEQLQMDVYGDVFQTAWLFANERGRLDPEFGERLAEMADLVCDEWSRPDSGIWEVRDEPRHFTQSKMMCWVALDRARRLAQGGHLPSRNAARWLEATTAIGSFIESRCWSERRRSYTRSADADALDAAVLLGVVFGYGEPMRARATIDAIRDDLAQGPLVMRYRAPDGVTREGAFVSCSFWLTEALARIGRRDDAARLFEQVMGLANDVGLYSEEIDRASSAFLGNFPQGLTHLSLISAAAAILRPDGRGEA
jgi:GH15 family glucan-1,4-alpha-glucosidase